MKAEQATWTDPAEPLTVEHDFGTSVVVDITDRYGRHASLGFATERNPGRVRVWWSGLFALGDPLDDRPLPPPPAPLTVTVFAR